MRRRQMRTHSPYWCGQPESTGDPLFDLTGYRITCMAITFMVLMTSAFPTLTRHFSFIGLIRQPITKTRFIRWASLATTVTPGQMILLRAIYILAGGPTIT